ncbi:uncharacterized protein MKZ38_004748 [Zalerion maritima]|uniref:Nucleoside 2-deoxyribosyltransferase like n=1 Tax=Zalerion maritima TaxID=339359 RepID=A0AAD5WUE4_9PEZI|nr:uncharacterized protein MKZ38_004748 [Zalerion maritima]
MDSQQPIEMPIHSDGTAPEPSVEETQQHAGEILCREFKAPEEVVVRGKSVFLAGSIEMGKARNWQEELKNKLLNVPCTIINPRRVDFGGDWVQEMSDPKLYQQVTWELDWLNNVDVIAMNFERDTKAPISLLELGLYAATGKMVVCCPVGFYRRGNVQIVCQRYGIPIFTELPDMVGEVVHRLTH